MRNDGNSDGNHTNHQRVDGIQTGHQPGDHHANNGMQHQHRNLQTPTSIHVNAAVDEHARRNRCRQRGSVLTLDHEVGTTDRPGEFGLLPGELESGSEFRRNFHAIGELEPNCPLT